MKTNTDNQDIEVLKEESQTLIKRMEQLLKEANKLIEEL